MRNTDLDKTLDIDNQIGELKKDESGMPYRIVNERKVYQIEELSQHDIDMNLIINRYRASK